MGKFTSGKVGYGLMACSCFFDTATGLSCWSPVAATFDSCYEYSCRADALSTCVLLTCSYTKRQAIMNCCLVKNALPVWFTSYQIWTIKDGYIRAKNVSILSLLIGWIDWLTLTSESRESKRPDCLNSAATSSPLMTSYKKVELIRPRLGKLTVFTEGSW